MHALIAAPVLASLDEYVGVPLVVGCFLGGLMFIAFAQCIAALREIALNSRATAPKPAGRGQYLGMQVASWVLTAVGVIALGLGIYVLVGSVKGRDREPSFEDMFSPRERRR